LEPVFGEMEKKFMKKKGPKFGPDGYEDDDPSDPDFPVGKLTRIPDFLPPPEELAKAPVHIKVTINLNLESFQFFKRQAAKHHTKYQKMIRAVLDHYVAAHQQK
jgi:hypothetical protein